jgi:transposase
VELMAAGKPVAELAEELCVSSNLLYNWRLKLQDAQGGSAAARAVGEGSEADALRILRRENARLKEENLILKKAAVILGTKIQPNSAL